MPFDNTMYFFYEELKLRAKERIWCANSFWRKRRREGIDATIEALKEMREEKKTSPKHLPVETVEEITKAIRKRAGELAGRQGDPKFDAGRGYGIEGAMRAITEFLPHVPGWAID